MRLGNSPGFLKHESILRIVSRVFTSIWKQCADNKEAILVEREGEALGWLANSNHELFLVPSGGSSFSACNHCAR